MDNWPLVIEEIDAGVELIRQFDKTFPVKVAFWLKASDEPYRHLYIASDSITDGNLKNCYAKVSQLAVGSPYFDPFRVKLINSNHNFAIAATDIQQQYPSASPIRYGGTYFGGITVDDIYIYPSTFKLVASS